MLFSFSNRIFSYFTSLILPKVTELLNYPIKIGVAVATIGKSGETGRFSVTSNFLRNAHRSEETNYET